MKGVCFHGECVGGGKKPVIFPSKIIVCTRANRPNCQKYRDNPLPSVTLNVCDINHQKSIATCTKTPSYPFLSASPTRDYLTQNKATTLWNKYTQEIEEKVPNIFKRADSCSSSSQVLLSSHSDREESWPLFFPGLTYCQLL